LVGDHLPSTGSNENLLLAFVRLNEIFVLSTCNWMIYGFAEDADQLIDLLCAQTTGSKKFFRAGLCKKRSLLLSKSFQCGSGSRFTKFWVIMKLSGKSGGQYLQKIKVCSLIPRKNSECGILIFKVIKNQTAISDGTVSVSFAAVQYLKKKYDIAGKKVLLFRVGKIGRTTCQKSRDYLGQQYHVDQSKQRESR
jgi:glutamyl-tRNA reductase